MASYRTISPTFWSDPFVEELTAEEKVVFLYLFTNSQVNNLGITEVTNRKLSFDTGAKAGTIKEFLKKAVDAGKIYVDGNKILCVNFIKNQTHMNKNEKISQYLLKNLTDLYSSTPATLAKVLATAYPTFFSLKEDIQTNSTPPLNTSTTVKTPLEGIAEATDPLKTVSIPPTDAFTTLSKPYADRPRDKEVEREVEVEREREREKEKIAPTPQDMPESVSFPRTPAESEVFPSSEPISEKQSKEPNPKNATFREFVEAFQREIKAEWGATAPVITESLIEKGANEIRLSISSEGFTWEEIQDALEWAKNDAFWRQQIKSLASIRKKSGSNGCTKLQNMISSFRDRGSKGLSREEIEREARHREIMSGVI